MNNHRFEQEFELAFDKLIKSYPEKAHSSVEKDKSKYFEELSVLRTVLIENQLDQKRPRILDVGGGSGNLSVLITHLFSCDMSMVDRMDEFSEEYERVMGNRQDVLERLELSEITFVNSDPFTETYCADQEFDIILNFDVIEHLPHSVPRFIEKMYELLAVNGHLILSTPNQVHLKNRYQSLRGRNTWEDFEYYITTDRFFGHIRELTYIELAYLLKEFPRYKILGRTHQLNRYGKSLKKYKPLKSMMKFLIDNGNPRLAYQFFAVVQKCP